MFSYAATPHQSRLEMRGAPQLRERCSAVGLEHDARSSSFALDWPELDAILPDGGLPRRLVELSAPRALGATTSVALAAIRARFATSTIRFAAWIDPEATLYAPGVEQAGVDRSRLVVVRPPREKLQTIALSIVSSSAFDIVVVDFDPIAFSAPSFYALRRPGLFARRLALAVESSDTTVLLITDSTRRRALPLPVALRLELSRTNLRVLAVRVSKERHGRIDVEARCIPFREIER